MSVRDDKVEVLLVEDNPTDAELCIRALREHNLANELVWVKDGEEALDFLFREGAYAGRSGVETLKVVLLDLRLPKVDGLEVLRRVKSDDRTKCLPVVVLTSSKEDRDVVKAITTVPTASSASLSASRHSPRPWRNLDCTGWWSTVHRPGVDHGRARRSRNTAVDPRGRPRGCGTGRARVAQCRLILPLAQGRHACRLPGRTGIRSIPI